MNIAIFLRTTILICERLLLSVSRSDFLSENTSKCLRVILEFAKSRVIRACVPTWSTCQRACEPAWFTCRRACEPACFKCQRACVPAWFTCQRACMPMCQKRTHISFLRTNVPTAIRRANVLTWRANVPNGVPIFQFGMPACQKACQFFKHSSYEMLREISIIYYYTVKPAYSGHLRFLKKVSAITRCPLYRVLDFLGKIREQKLRWRIFF